MGPSPWARRSVRIVAAGLAGSAVVAAGALVGSRLAEPPSAVVVLNTVALAADAMSAESTPTAPPPAPLTTPTAPAPVVPTTSAVATTGTTVTATRGLMRGDCVDDRTGSEVRVPCEQPHTREIAAVLDADGLEREFGTTARPAPGSTQEAALTAYCQAQVASYLPRPLAPSGRFRPAQWLIVPEAWVHSPGVECVVEEYQVTAADGMVRVTRTGSLRTDLPADQGLDIPVGACFEVATDRFDYVACPGGNARAIGSIDWPASDDSADAGRACVALLPPTDEVGGRRLRFSHPSDADLAAGARRAVCFLVNAS